jgi:hypothetical protein
VGHIAVGGIKKIDPDFERALDERSALLLAEAPGIIAPFGPP